MCSFSVGVEEYHLFRVCGLSVSGGAACFVHSFSSVLGRREKAGITKMLVRSGSGA